MEDRHYATLREGVRTHLVGAPYEGTRSLCGVFVPMGANVSKRDTLWRVQPCQECAAVLRRSA
jgi:hypothetical protein